MDNNEMLTKNSGNISIYAYHIIFTMYIYFNKYNHVVTCVNLHNKCNELGK